MRKWIESQRVSEDMNNLCQREHETAGVDLQKVSAQLKKPRGVPKKRSRASTGSGSSDEDLLKANKKRNLGLFGKMREKKKEDQ